ncbi:hypothetical protein K402DRAFT_420770, partial [Aulographum hederae CBS 113979]
MADSDDDTEGPANPSHTEPPESPLDVAQFYEQSQLLNPALYKKKTVNEFIDYVFNSYKVGELKDEVLTEEFREDFAMFDRSNWAAIDKSRLAMIKLTLRNNGCYVPTGTKRGTPSDLEDVIVNSLQWPLNDPKCPAYIINKVYEGRERSEQLVGSNSPRSVQHYPRQHTEPASRTPPHHRTEPVPRALPATERRRTPFVPSPHDPSSSIEPRPEPFPHPLSQTPAIQPSSPPLRTEARLPTAAEMILAVQKEQSSPDNTIVTLTKMYGDKDKYSGASDESFLDKFSTFIDLSQRAGVSSERLGIAFPVMLKERALDYYRQSCQKERDISTLVAYFEAHFENIDHRLQKLDEWQSINLTGEFRKESNAGKPKSEVFNNMVNRLRQVQHSLPPEMRTESMLHQKLLSAIRDMPEYASIASIGHTALNPLVNGITIALGRGNVPG